MFKDPFDDTFKNTFRETLQPEVEGSTPTWLDYNGSLDTGNLNLFGGASAGPRFEGVSCDKIDSQRAFYSYQRANVNDITGRIVRIAPDKSVTGTGFEILFSSTGTPNTATTNLSSTRTISASIRSGDAEARIITHSADPTDVNYSFVAFLYKLYTGTVDEIAVAALDSTRFLICWADVTNNKGSVAHVTFNDANPTSTKLVVDTVIDFEATTKPTKLDMVQISATQALISYYDGTNLVFKLIDSPSTTPSVADTYSIPPINAPISDKIKLVKYQEDGVYAAWGEGTVARTWVLRLDMSGGTIAGAVANLVANESADYISISSPEPTIATVHNCDSTGAIGIKTYVQKFDGVSWSAGPTVTNTAGTRSWIASVAYNSSSIGLGFQVTPPTNSYQGKFKALFIE
jgi:hypothetical protein